MPKNLFFQVLNPTGQRYRYGLEVIYQERHLPTLLSIFFCSVSYKKVEGKGFVVDSQKTSSFNFDYNSGNLRYVSYHKGDFTKSGFSWADTRTAYFEYDTITDLHRTHAKKTAQKAYSYLQEQKIMTNDRHWQEKHEPFLSPLEVILGLREKT